MNQDEPSSPAAGAGVPGASTSDNPTSTTTTTHNPGPGPAAETVITGERTEKTVELQAELDKALAELETLRASSTTDKALIKERETRINELEDQVRTYTTPPKPPKPAKPVEGKFRIKVRARED